MFIRNVKGIREWYAEISAVVPRLGIGNWMSMVLGQWGND